MNWNGVAYDIHGTLNAAGGGSARAGKSQAAQNLAGPRFFTLAFELTDEGAQGVYAVEGQSASCRARVALASG